MRHRLLRSRRRSGSPLHRDRASRRSSWDPEDGDWRAVVMNADATRVVSADMSIGAELDSALWIGIGLLGVGLLFAAGSALAITAAVRRRR